MDMKTMMKIKNRSASFVVYRAQLDNGNMIRRELQPGETIKVPYEELVKLSYRPGGRQLMENFLHRRFLNCVMKIRFLLTKWKMVLTMFRQKKVCC